MSENKGIALFFIGVLALTVTGWGVIGFVIYHFVTKFW